MVLLETLEFPWKLIEIYIDIAKIAIGKNPEDIYRHTKDLYWSFFNPNGIKNQLNIRGFYKDWQQNSKNSQHKFIDSYINTVSKIATELIITGIPFHNNTRMAYKILELS